MSNFDIIAELNNLKIDFKIVTGNVHCKCPSGRHADEHPSCIINLKTQNFHCFSCKAGGGFPTFVWFVRRKELPYQAMLKDLCRRHKKTFKAPDVTLDQIYRYREELWLKRPKKIFDKLVKQAITEDMAQQYLLGFDQVDRLTIPIFDHEGYPVLLLGYHPDPGPNGIKMVPIHGTTKGRRYVFPQGQFEYDKIVICGGELKAALAAYILNAEGYGAISVTGGERELPDYVVEQLRDKQVLTCFDVDMAGLEAAAKCCRQLCVRSQVWSLDLSTCKNPLNRGDYPRGDINNYVYEKGAQAFVDTIIDTYAGPQWENNPIVDLASLPCVNSNIIEACNGSMINGVVQLDGTMFDLDPDNFTHKYSVEVSCPEKGRCSMCPNEVHVNFKSNVILPNFDSDKITMVDGKAADKDSIVKRTFHDCQKFKWIPNKTIEVTRCRVGDRTNSSMGAYVVGPLENAVEHRKLTFKGQVIENRATNELVLWAFETKEPHYEIAEGAIDQFKPAELTATSIMAKLIEIAEHWVGVTNTFNRTLFHIWIDLTLHSVVPFTYNGIAQGGPMNILVVGDNGVGKTHTVSTIFRYLDIDESAIMFAGSITEPGLIVATPKVGGKYIARPGAFVKNNGRVLMIDEMKSLNIYVFEKIANILSSGEVKSVKAAQGFFKAHTRLISLSNPRPREDGVERSIESYPHPSEVFRDLVITPEYLRRVTACYPMYNAIKEPETAADQSLGPVFKQTDMQVRLLESWKREISFDVPVHIVDKYAQMLIDAFACDMPIIDRMLETARTKLIRVAAAIANATSTHVVQECHVEVAKDLFWQTYASDYMQLHKRAVACELNVKRITSVLNSMTDPRTFVRVMLNNSGRDLSLRLLKEVAPGEVEAAITVLIGINAIKEGRRYDTIALTNEFVQILNQLSQPNSGLRTLAQAPEHTKE